MWIDGWLGHSELLSHLLILQDQLLFPLNRHVVQVGLLSRTRPLRTLVRSKDVPFLFMRDAWPLLGQCGLSRFSHLDVARVEQLLGHRPLSIHPSARLQ